MIGLWSQLFASTGMQHRSVAVAAAEIIQACYYRNAGETFDNAWQTALSD